MRITEVSEVARLLDEFGRRALLYGGNPYRAKAYLRAAERVALLTEPLDAVVKQQGGCMCIAIGGLKRIIPACFNLHVKPKGRLPTLGAIMDPDAATTRKTLEIRAPRHFPI